MLVTTILIVALVITVVVAGYQFWLLRSRRKRELDEAEERRSMFVSIISHQLRTPLSIIKGYLEGLVTGDQGKLSAGQQEYASEALRVSQGTIALVNDYLKAVKLDPEEMELERSPVNLGDVVRQEVKGVEPLARASNCTVRYDPPAGTLPSVSIDVVKLRQVIQNILANAIKYTSGKGEVTVALRHHGGSLEFSCRDNGVGIPAKDQEFVFTKFFRGKNVLHKDTTGSGLGLYLARVIIQAHGGNIWLTSEENKGTVVYFSLPVAS